MKPTIIQYTRKPNGQLNGCFVGAQIDGSILIGYSKCSNLDRFNKKFARELATRRMNSGRDMIKRIPQSMVRAGMRFQERCQRQFADVPF